MPPSSQPQHWVTDGGSPQCFPVKPWSDEGMAVAGYFLEGMPKGTEIDVIERWEHGPLYSDYFDNRDDVLRDMGVNPRSVSHANSARESVEAWLFCATSAVDEVLTDGFPATDSNMHEGRFGLGVYFARDARLPHFVMSRMNVSRQGNFQSILARVTVGRCWRQTALRRAGDPVKDEHCQPPAGHHSCTLQRAPGCEVIVFPGLGCTPAYPAYVVTYRAQVPIRADPYEELAMLRVGLVQNKVLNAHPFKQYLAQCRPNWSTSSMSQTGEPRLQAWCPVQSLDNFRAAHGGSGEMLPTGSPISAVRARHSEDEANASLPSTDHGGNALQFLRELQDEELFKKSRKASGGARITKGPPPPMLSVGALPASIKAQERVLRPRVSRAVKGPRRKKALQQRPQSATALDRHEQAQTDGHAWSEKTMRPSRTQSAAALLRADSMIEPWVPPDDIKRSLSFRSQSTEMAMSMRPECAEDLGEAMTSGLGEVVLEVSNLPDLSSTGMAPEVYISEMLNPKLQLLKDFDASKGEGIHHAWSHNGESVTLELQSKWLVASTARILDDLPLFGSKLQVRVVQLDEIEGTFLSDAPQAEAGGSRAEQERLALVGLSAAQVAKDEGRKSEADTEEAVALGDSESAQGPECKCTEAEAGVEQESSNSEQASAGALGVSASPAAAATVVNEVQADSLEVDPATADAHEVAAVVNTGSVVDEAGSRACEVDLASDEVVAEADAIEASAWVDATALGGAQGATMHASASDLDSTGARQAMEDQYDSLEVSSLANTFALEEAQSAEHEEGARVDSGAIVEANVSVPDAGASDSLSTSEGVQAAECQEDAAVIAPALMGARTCVFEAAGEALQAHGLEAENARGDSAVAREVEDSVVETQAAECLEDATFTAPALLEVQTDALENGELIDASAFQEAQAAECEEEDAQTDSAAVTEDHCVTEGTLLTSLAVDVPKEEKDMTTWNVAGNSQHVDGHDDMLKDSEEFHRRPSLEIPEKSLTEVDAVAGALNGGALDALSTLEENRADECQGGAPVLVPAPMDAQSHAHLTGVSIDATAAEETQVAESEDDIQVDVSGVVEPDADATSHRGRLNPTAARGAQVDTRGTSKESYDYTPDFDDDDGESEPD